jgi:hypothetical protein
VADGANARADKTTESSAVGIGGNGITIIAVALQRFPCGLSCRQITGIICINFATDVLSASSWARGTPSIISVSEGPLAH